MILDEIAAKTKIRVERAKQEISPEKMKELAEQTLARETASGGGMSQGETSQRNVAAGTFSFEENLRQPGISFICEVKKASPSKGIIAEDFDYLSIAREYEAAGADAMSVLTEPDYFLGNISYLKEISQTVKTPLLRKDFTIDEYMIYEAKAAGASLVLLICALLPEATIRRYIEICDSLGLSALVEAHDEEEIAAAVSAGARIIGVNNRNLKDFTVDIHNGIRLRERVPENILFVAESGIRTREDIIELEKGRVNGVLIGETLMRSSDKKAMLDKLRGTEEV